MTVASGSSRIHSDADDDVKRPSGVTVLAHDITERNQQLNASKGRSQLEPEPRVQAASDAEVVFCLLVSAKAAGLDSCAGMVIVDDQGVITEWSERAADITGVSKVWRGGCAAPVTSCHGVDVLLRPTLWDNPSSRSLWWTATATR